jgi:integrase
LSWSHVGDDAIVLRTGKSKQRREAIVPLYDNLRALLGSIPKVSTTVLANSRRKPWTADGLKTAIQRAKVAAKWDDKDLHFHDLRGTAATRFYVAGLNVRVIAEIMGWEEKTVDKIIRRYVGRNAATRAAIAQLPHGLPVSGNGCHCSQKTFSIALWRQFWLPDAAIGRPRPRAFLLLD